MLASFLKNTHLFLGFIFSEFACIVTTLFLRMAGFIRDHNGAWVAGFGMNIGSCSVTVAELWGLYQGLNVAWQTGIRWLQVEVDSLCILQLVTTPRITTNEFSPLLKSIRNLISRNWRITINSVYREANFAADYKRDHNLQNKEYLQN